MSVEKQDGKLSAVFTLGSFVENSLEKYRKELLGLEGTRQALFVLVKKFEEYIQVVDYEADNKVISFNEASVAKRHVAACVGIVREIAKISDVQLHQAEGKIAAADKFVTDLKAMFDEEKTSLDKLREEIEEAKSKAEAEAARLAAEALLPQAQPIPAPIETKANRTPSKHSRSLKR